MPGTFISYRLESFTRGFHVGDSVWNHRANARIVAGIKTVYGDFDIGHGGFIGWRAVENKCRRKVDAIGSETERLSPAPAEPRHVKFSVRRRQFIGVVSRRIQVRRDLIGIQFADGFRYTRRKILGAPASFLRWPPPPYNPAGTCSGFSLLAASVTPAEKSLVRPPLGAMPLNKS